MHGMTDASVRRWTGVLGIISAILFVFVEAPLYFVYSDAPPDWNILTRVLINFIGCMTLIAFLAGLRQVIRRADHEYEWIATLAFGAGLLYVAMILVAQSMEGG